MRMIRGVEGLFSMMQSWFRAQFDVKKLAKINEFQFLSLISPQNQGQMSLFLFRNVTTNYVTDVSLNRKVDRGVKGQFFERQSVRRAQFDKKILPKKNKLQFFVSFFLRNESQI